jgi:hypothetical protein
MCRRWEAICLQAYVPICTEYKVFRSKSTGRVLHLQSSASRHSENTARKLRDKHERKWELYQSAVVTNVDKTRTTLSHFGTPLQSAWPSHIATQGSWDLPSQSLWPWPLPPAPTRREATKPGNHLREKEKWVVCLHIWRPSWPLIRGSYTDRSHVSQRVRRRLKQASSSAMDTRIANGCRRRQTLWF